MDPWLSGGRRSDVEGRVEGIFKGQKDKGRGGEEYFHYLDFGDGFLCV